MEKWLVFTSLLILTSMEPRKLWQVLNSKLLMQEGKSELQDVRRSFLIFLPEHFHAGMSLQ
jgi:hypothetical protein